LSEKTKEVLTDLVLLRSTSDDDAKPIVDYVSDRLKRLGLKPKYYGDKSRPAIVAEHGSGGVVLSGHLDTVPHGDGWQHEDGEVKAGRLYGRGACDMKGGCTAMLLAAENLAAANVPFTLCFTTDEETTMLGAGAAAKDPAFSRAPAILVTEPTAFEIVVKEKGLLQFSVSTQGISAHASMPHLGENAIHKMVGLLSKLGDLQEIPKNPNSEMTLCVDTIKGGTRINVIPGECSAEIDVRYPPNMNTDSVLEAVRKRIGRDGYSLKILHELAPVETDASLPAVKALKELIGPEAVVTSVPYATEMVMFRDANKALMVCGPGDPRICHCDDEWVDVTEVAKAVDIYVEYCSRMTGR
jgi:acetylornithine deacetylase/succinyl-diaminopimelate desuccinylase-like protein